MAKLLYFIFSSVRISTTFIYGSTGETIAEKSGHLNLGIPGTMCIGALGGMFGAELYTKIVGTGEMVWIFAVLFPTFFAFLFGAAAGLLYSFLTVTLRCNQNVTGLSITTFGVGFTNYFRNRIGGARFAEISKLISMKLPFAENTGWFGEIFLSYGVLVYLAIVVAIIASVVLKKTKTGLYLRAVGENPATADAAGINVSNYRYIATCIGCGIAGLGGMFYVMDYLGGSKVNSIDAVGWLAIALVIFSMWRPALGILGSVIFGALFIVAEFNFIPISQDIRSVKSIIEMLPYVVTIVVLVITSIKDKKENQPPAGLGLNYFREDR